MWLAQLGLVGTFVSHVAEKSDHGWILGIGLVMPCWGLNRGEDGHVSQASCASGEGQLEGVENQPFPPPEGAPEDSSSNWQTSPGICPMALANVPWGNAKKQS